MPKKKSLKPPQYCREIQHQIPEELFRERRNGLWEKVSQKKIRTNERRNIMYFIIYR